MTIRPRLDQKMRIQEAIEAGLVHSAEEIIDAGLEHLSAGPSAGESPDKVRALAAAARIRESRKGVTLGGLTIRALIDEGRAVSRSALDTHRCD
jgi:hypothetical protein